jgi:prephenate dehydratase
VEHTLLALPGVKLEDVKIAMSHPQALAQCDNFLRSLNITPEAAYDTAGSAKIIKEKVMNSDISIDMGNDYAAIAQRLHSVCTAFTQRLRSICAVFTQRLRSVCAAFA